MRDALATALGSIDGAGTRPTVVFSFDGEIDGRSLPATAADSLTASSAVVLFDADESSPDAFSRIPIEVELARDRRSIHARVAFGRALPPGRRYAAVVTDTLRARSGNHRVGPAKGFELVLDEGASVPDALSQRARAQYLPLLPAFEANGIGRSRIIAIASFRVQDVERDLDDARASIAEQTLEPPSFEEVLDGAALDEQLGEAGIGAVGAVLGEGVAHQHLAALAHLSVRTPMFASVDEGQRNAFRRDERGALEPRGFHDVPCSLMVPRSSGSAPISLVLFQHGVFGERSDALPIANELAAAGYAVLSCDAPQHGSRLSGSDTGNRFTGSSAPDGFGDVLGDVLGQEIGAGELAPLHPFYYRDATQQAVADWLAIVATLRLGEWDAALHDALGSDEPTLARTNIGFIGVDLGAEIGVALASREPEIAAVVLAFAGGRGIDDWDDGPDYEDFREAYSEILAREDEQGFTRAFRSDLEVLRTLLDPATGLAHAARLRRSSTNLLQLVAAEDELVPLSGSEALAYASGAVLVDAEPRYELGLTRDRGLPGAAIAGNFSLARGSVTRVAQVLSPATHATLFTSQGIVRYEHPLDTELHALDEEQEVVNQTAAAMRQVVFFFASHRACRIVEQDPELPCAASVSALGTSR